MLAGHLPKQIPMQDKVTKKQAMQKKKFGIGKNIAGSDAENIILAQNNHPPNLKSTISDPLVYLLTELLLFPVDRDTHDFFCRLQSNVFEAASLFQINHVVL